MSDPDFEPKDELQESFKKRRISSEQSNDSVFGLPSSPRVASSNSPSSPRVASPNSPSSPQVASPDPPPSPREASSDLPSTPRLASPNSPSSPRVASPNLVASVVKPVDTQPSEEPLWTVVDVSTSLPNKEAPKVVLEPAKAPMVTKPKPAPPPKIKPKSPQSNASQSPVKTSAPRPSKPEPPKSVSKPVKPVPLKPVNSAGKIKVGGADENVSKVELKKLEIERNDGNDSKTSISPSMGVKSILSVFEGSGREMPSYAKPDMTQKKPKSFFINKGETPSAPIVNDNPIEEEIHSNESPPIPDRNYSEEDISLATKSPPVSPPSPERDGSTQSSPELDGFNSSKFDMTLDESTPEVVENPYEVVEPRTVKPLVPSAQENPSPPPPPPHNRKVSRKDMSPAPPSPYKDRRPSPPSRDASLPKVDPDYAEVGELRRNESPYSEVVDRSSTPEVEAYFTRDVVADFVTKMNDAKRQAPPKPLPYKTKDVVAVETKIRAPPPKPAPFRPKSIQDSFPNSIVTSQEERLQSPETPFSPKFPVVVPGSPTLSSAKLLNSSSPPLNRPPPQFKPPPPPRVSSIAGTVNDNVIKASTSVIEARNLYSGVEVNGGFDKNEIPTRDINGTLQSKPALPSKPLVGPKPFQAKVDIGPPNFKPPPPLLSSSLFTRANGITSDSITSDRETTGAQNGTDSFNIVAPPPMDYLYGRSERSASRTSLDSLDLKIVPPPPMHFKEFDNNNDTETVNLDLNLQALFPPSGWEETTDNNNINGSSNSRKARKGFKRGSQKSNDLAGFDLEIVPPPPPTLPPPTLPLSSQADYDLELMPSTLSYEPGELNIDDILGDFEQNLSIQPDYEDSLPPSPQSPVERYMGVPPPPGDGLIKPLVPPLRKER